MPEQIETISFNGHPVVEILKSEDGVKLTIRSAENHEHKIELPASILSTLIDRLKKFG